MPVNDALLHGPFYGNFYVRVVGAVGFAFLMGSIPFGPIAVWLFGELDARIASAARGFAPVFDFGKTALPVAIATHGGGPAVGTAAAVAAVIGHYFCPWLRFRGPDGAAAELGALTGLCWPAALIFASIWFVVAAASDYAIAGTILATVVSIVSLWFFLGPLAALGGVGMLLAVGAGHRDRLERLAAAEEPLMRERVTEAESVVRLNGQPIQSC